MSLTDKEILEALGIPLDRKEHLKDLLERYVARRTRTAHTGASVRRRHWTENERMYFGALNEMKSLEYALSKATNPEAVENTKRYMAECQARIDKYKGT